MTTSTNGDAPLIRLEGVSKVFYTDEVETHALSKVSLEIRDGEYVAISGPSGCGKSTLLSILGLLDTPTEGVYLLHGESVEKLKARQRARIRNRQIGFIFQAFNLIGDLTVYENVELPLTYRGMPARRTEEAHRGGSRPGGNGAPNEALPFAAVGRPAAKSRGRPGAGRRPVSPARGRADGQPRLQERGGSDGSSAGCPRGRGDDLHGHARPEVRGARRAGGATLRRNDRGVGARQPARLAPLRRRRIRLVSRTAGDPPVSRQVTARNADERRVKRTQSGPRLSCGRSSRSLLRGRALLQAPNATTCADQSF